MNPHAVLGVRPGASQEEIRAAWRRVAKATHPDNGGDPDAFAAAAEAYERLADDPYADDAYAVSGAAEPEDGGVVVIHLGIAGLSLRWARRRFTRASRVT
jgi:DnaJ-class molecular chaperone